MGEGGQPVMSAQVGFGFVVPWMLRCPALQRWAAGACASRGVRGVGGFLGAPVPPSRGPLSKTVAVPYPVLGLWGEVGGLGSSGPSFSCSAPIFE